MLENRPPSLEVPEQLVPCVAELFSALDTEIVRDWAKRNPGDFPGFSWSPKKGDRYRKRMMALFVASRTLPAELVWRLMGSTTYFDIVSTLSEEALLALGRKLVLLYWPDRELLLGTLALDHRQSVRELALSLATSDLPHAEEDRDDAFRQTYADLALFREVFMEPLIRFGKLMSEGKAYRIGSEPPEEANPEDAPSVGGADADPKGVRKRLAKTEEKVVKLERLNGKLKVRNDRQRAKLSELKALLDNELAEHAKTKTSIETEVRELLKYELSSEIRSWVSAPRGVLGYVTASASDDVIEAGEELIRRQAELDRHYGNIASLKSRRAALSDLKERIDDARLQSLNPLPDLAALSVRCVDALETIEIVLTGITPPRLSSTALDLLRRSNEAPDEGGLDEIQRLVDAMGAARLLTPDEVGALGEALGARRGFHADRRRFTSFGSADGHEAGWAVANVFGGAAPFCLVIDGHNVLFRLKERFSSTFENEAPTQKSQSALLKAVGSLVHPTPEGRAEVFFDSPVFEMREYSDKVVVVFSGETGSDRADRAIIRRCEELLADPRGGKVLVVTEDRWLRSEVGALGADVVHPREIEPFLFPTAMAGAHSAEEAA